MVANLAETTYIINTTQYLANNEHVIRVINKSLIWKNTEKQKYVLTTKKSA